MMTLPNLEEEKLIAKSNIGLASQALSLAGGGGSGRWSW